jgi:hypothetical protein
MPKRTPNRAKPEKSFTTQQSLNSEIKGVCDIMRWNNCAGTRVKTNRLFFEKGKRTKKIWYYDLSDIKTGKCNPFTLDKFDDFFKRHHNSGLLSWSMI